MGYPDLRDFINDPILQREVESMQLYTIYLYGVLLITVSIGYLCKILLE